MKKLIFYICILFFAGISAFLIVQNAKSGSGDPISKKTIQFYTGSKNISLELLKFQNNDTITHKLRYQNNIFSKLDFELTGFEDEVSVCNQKEIELSEGVNALCLTGEVGAHSQNLQLLKIGNDIEPVFFSEDGGKTRNITSDLPEFRILNYNDNIVRVESKMRDYDKNPVSDSITFVYKYDKGQFVLDK